MVVGVILKSDLGGQTNSVHGLVCIIARRSRIGKGFLEILDTHHHDLAWENTLGQDTIISSITCGYTACHTKVISSILDRV